MDCGYLAGNCECGLIAETYGNVYRRPFAPVHSQAFGLHTPSKASNRCANVDIADHWSDRLDTSGVFRGSRWSAAAIPHTGADQIVEIPRGQTRQGHNLRAWLVRPKIRLTFCLLRPITLLDPVAPEAPSSTWRTPQGIESTGLFFWLRLRRVDLVIRRDELPVEVKLQIRPVTAISGRFVDTEMHLAIQSTDKTVLL